MRKDFLVALSLANLFYVKVWDYTLYNYAEWGLSGAMSLVAVVLNVFLLALIFWSAIRVGRKSSSLAVKLVGCGGLVILVILALNLAWAFLPYFTLDKLQQWLSTVGVPSKLFQLELFVAGTMVGALLGAHRYMVNVATTILVILSPLSLILVGNGVWLWYKGALATSTPLARPLLVKKEGPRIVWIVFDELDYRVAFVERPISLQLPEFDRFRSQSIDAMRAVSPADYTQRTMPSLITGKLVSAYEPIQLNEWLLTLGKKERVGWSTISNVFSRAREAGFNSGLAGWFLPYCRIIGRDLADCYSQLQRDRHRQMSLFEAMLDQAKEVLPAVLPNRLIDKNARNLKIYERQTHLFVYQGVRAEAKKLAVNRSLGLVLLHYPVPHTSGVYNRRKDGFSIEPGANYLDNLRLADRTLGELRHAMEQAGLWEETIVLVTSDHRWRTEIWDKRLDWTPEEAALAARLTTTDHRVPYLLKLAGQKQVHPYYLEFNTVVTHDLLLAILRGELASTDSVVKWLDQHRSSAETQL